MKKVVLDQLREVWEIPAGFSSAQVRQVLGIRYELDYRQTDTLTLAEDVDIDFLAQRFEFVGGNIKNCILNAAFLAAADPEAGGEVHMKHYLQAIKYEFVKTGKVFTRSDFEPYANLVL